MYSLPSCGYGEPDQVCARGEMKETAPSFLLEADWFHDPKVLSLECDYGEVMAARFLKLVGIARHQEGYFLYEKFSKAFAYQLRLTEENYAQTINALVEKELLVHDKRQQRFYFPGLIRRMEAYESKREQGRRAAKSRWLKGKPPCESIARAMPTQCNTNTNTNINTKDLSLGDTRTLSYPEGFDTPEIKQAFEKWAQALKLKWGRTLDQLTVDAIIQGYRGGPEKLEADVLAAAAGQWKNVRPGAGQAQSGNGVHATGPPRFLTTAQRNQQASIDAAKQIFTELGLKNDP